MGFEDGGSRPPEGFSFKKAIQEIQEMKKPTHDFSVTSPYDKYLDQKQAAREQTSIDPEETKRKIKAAIDAMKRPTHNFSVGRSYGSPTHNKLR